MALSGTFELRRGIPMCIYPMCIYLCVYVDGVYTYVYMSSVSISSDIEFYIEQYIEFVYMCVYIDGVYTARSREDETRNARRNANRNHHSSLFKWLV